MYDILIKNGQIIDGSGAKSKYADVGVRDGKIISIGDIDSKASITLNAEGMVVSPGFIDLHTHSDFTLVINGRAESQVHQGVTTEVVGQCGLSCAPVRNRGGIAVNSIGYIDGVVEANWTTFSEYLDHLDSIPLGVNVAAFVGHGTLHHTIVGDELRGPNDDELENMKSLLAESIEGGAYGLSSGLEYWPGNLASFDQLAELAKIAAKKDVLYATHVRNRDVYYDQGFGEAISTARVSGARLQISHIQPKFGAPSYAMQHTIDMCQKAQNMGVDVAFDVIPHDWAHTKIIAILPEWAQEGGPRSVAVRLQDRKIREKIKRNPRPMWLLVSAGHWDKIVLMHSNHNHHLVGMKFSEIAQQRNKDPYDVIFDLLLEEGEQMSQLLWTSQSFCNQDIKLALSQPECAVISDTLALAPYGDLKDHVGSLSGYGWAAKFLQHYVRDEGVLNLEDGIRRITSLPASRLGVADRGLIKTDLFADITVFDPKGIESHCGIDDLRRYASGIVHVLVNGKLSMHNGKRTDIDAGIALRR